MEDVLVYGLLRGGIYALAAFGFSLVLGVIGIVNFAHGALVVFGGLLTQYLAVKFGVPYAAAMIGGALGTGLLGAVIQRLFVARTFTLEPLMVLVQTFGIATVVTELGTLGWGSEERMLRLKTGLPPGFMLGDTFVPSFDLVVFAVSLVSAAVLFVVLGRTEFGRAIRACRDNRESAQLSGINLGRTFEKTMFLSGTWAGLAGAMFVTLSPVAPYMHFSWTVDSFLVITIGGLGSMLGALVGGLVFGVLSFGASFYAPTIAPAITFGVLLVFLVFRPQGLLGAGPAIRK
ncbi:branched-chain amino acid ABC transporter permease [Azospirillum canadense]|uniref:branched-chain amino acid ABC transporter permease n=1 Tax=Azospirillum canadense TaxID=403962 RepID=UPI0022279CF2|nr:branched-chain amino acid ABC transporter permease [Azospirillum canadense]MCW2241378.1 branched-chain amino acid transport system permease protein [Azospirillum canadense]